MISQVYIFRYRGLYLSHVFLFLMLTVSVLNAAPLQRIVVEETTNYRLSLAYQRLLLPESIEAAQYASLRQYVNIQLDPSPQHELANLFLLAAWVHQRWEHDAYGSAGSQAQAMDILRAAERGERFSCVEYSKVLREVLHAYGFVARVASLQASNIAYSGLGGAHVGVEVFSSQLDKWIYLDPQWGLYPLHQGKPINIYDYHILKQQNREQAISFKSVQSDKSNQQVDTSEYRRFFEQYLGFLSVDLLADKERVHVILAMQGTSWPLTFQGLPRNAQIFTRDAQDLYFDLNRVSLVLNYRHESQPLNHKQIEIASATDYMDKMSLFAAVPDFVVRPHHNMPWFSFYEFHVDNGGWKKLNSDSFDWRLHAGKNKLDVRAVNTAGQTGPVTSIKIDYAR